ncbi:dihydroxy-acid dehydratase domain-containing protein [Bradyrhizobium shewense]|uniref:dihydroxy-acid dehydratase domain-containing protein n=1 Tax=Bradyrhizobium shewense TaxID=1761772 RepID=UPI00101AD1E9
MVSAFETVGASCTGKMTREEFESIEQHSCTGLGVCGARYTACRGRQLSQRSASAFLD